MNINEALTRLKGSFVNRPGDVSITADEFSAILTELERLEDALVEESSGELLMENIYND
jgi:hypothetical protein